MTSTVESLPAKLLPCPFCGGASIDAKGWASGNSAGPACDDCGASAGCVSSDLADNIAAWNRRAAQPKDGELMALADQVDEAIGFAPTDVRDRARLALHQLRTLASRRVGVDEAMVERAARKAWGVAKFGVETADWDRAPEIRKTFVRDFARAALAAALQPDSGEG